MHMYTKHESPHLPAVEWNTFRNHPERERMKWNFKTEEDILRKTFLVKKKEQPAHYPIACSASITPKTEQFFATRKDRIIIMHIWNVTRRSMTIYYTRTQAPVPQSFLENCQILLT